MSNFAVHLDVVVDTSGLESSIVKGFALASAGMSKNALGMIRGLGVALSSRLVVSTGPATITMANQLLGDLREILSRPGHGNVYTTEWRTDKSGRRFPLMHVSRTPHQASAVGEPPAADTGGLRSSVVYEIINTVRGIVIRLGTPLDYGYYLEYGVGVEPRPWLRLLANAVSQRGGSSGVSRTESSYTVIIAGHLKRSALGFLSGFFRRT